MRRRRQIFTTLRSVRLSTLQLAAVTAVSLAATVVVIVNANGKTGLNESAVLAALDKKVVVHKIAAPATGGGNTNSANTGGGGGGGGGSNSGSGGSGGSNGGSGGSGDDSGSDDGGDDTTTTTTTTSSTTTTATVKYHVKHVFVIALSTPSYKDTFGKKSVATYLTKTLVKDGTVLSGYETLPGSSELADELAMVSGQAPTPDTRGGCATYAEFPSSAKVAANGDTSGNGCIYPDNALTVGDQVTSSGSFWGAYIDEMGSTPCVHPNSGAADGSALPGAGAEYDTRHNPFIYFHSLLDLGDCQTDDQPLTKLPSALRSVTNTPEFTFVAPDACDDAAATTCAGSAPVGLAGEDTFLKTWVPKIRASAAYKKDGVLLIVFTAPGGAGTAGSKAIKTGALVISQYAKAGKTVSATYDPYSVLASTDKLLGFTPLAQAKSAKTFIATALPGT
jgi:hypothetical protein